MDLDLYLFDCTTGTCSLWDIDFIHGTRAELLVRAPRPGVWKAVIDPARVAGGQTNVAYTEVVTNAAYGTVVVDTTSIPRATGARWTPAIGIHPGAPIAAGRQLVVVADLVDQVSEAAEQLHPLAVLGGPAYRPVVIATAVMPFGSDPSRDNVPER